MIAVALIILFIDLFTFKGLVSLLRNKQTILKIFFYCLHWLVPVSLFVSLFIMVKLSSQERSAAAIYHYFVIAGLFILFYLPKLVFIVFHILDDLFRGAAYLYRQIFEPKEHKTGIPQRVSISRRNFITKTGLCLAAIPFFSILGGTVLGRFNFKIHRVKIGFKNLPEAFSGLRIVQISDLHIGSFYGHRDQLEEAVQLINSLNPDLLFFTGDMVNTYAEEMDDFFDILIRLKAREGKFSILGNHDYGDYHSWKDPEKKAENFRRILDHEEKLGFRLLLNDSVLLQRGEESIAIAGVENWGKPPFTQYGDYKKAAEKIPDNYFRILLSHDPTHWDAVISRETDVDLTLSGHTHGMQFGMERGNVKWSPAQYKYPHWAGLYKQGKQYLYVNRGLGCIGYPGRVGMPPEITLIELFRS